jgi:hypothetical protein
MPLPLLLIARGKIWHEHVVHVIWAGELLRDSATLLLSKTDLAIEIVGDYL